MSKQKLFGALIWLRRPALIGAGAQLMYPTVVDRSPIGAWPARSAAADDDRAVVNTMCVLDARLETKRGGWATKRGGRHV